MGLSLPEESPAVSGRTMNGYHALVNCRLCESADLETVLDLGSHPPANSLRLPAASEAPAYPLTLLHCAACGLIQLRETLAKEFLFEQYFWVTGTSATARQYAETFAERALRTARLPKDSLVLEIASNDGTFLKPFQKRGLRALGVDPARNIAADARNNGVETIAEFWDAECARKILDERETPRLVVARNVLPHVSDLHEVLRGIAACLPPEGTGIAEFHDSALLLDQLQYDYIYHEHLHYFTLTSFEKALNKHGLHAFHVDRSPISGGSHVVYFAVSKRPASIALTALRREEAAKRIGERETWLDFAERCRAHREETLRLLSLHEGKNILAFGASARSSTYLNFCGLRGGKITAVVDNNPLKQGLRTPGSDIPIVSLSDGLRTRPEMIFLLAWNFSDEIISQCRAAGYAGEFLIPFPRRPKLDSTAHGRMS